MFPVPLAEMPLMVPLTDEVQVMVVDAIVDPGRKFKEAPLHTDCIKLAGVLVMAGTGLIVTVTSTEVPGQPFAEGVMRYTADPTFTPSELERIWLISEPFPPLAPLTFVELNTVQLKVVPVTLFEFAIETLEFEPEQIALSAAATLGIL